MTCYSDNVARWGGPHPHLIGGKRFNLRHATSFFTDEVKTDGMGNVLEQPLLEGKECFGRPERFIRGSYDEGSDWISPCGDLERSRTVCERCPLMFECADLCVERVSSDPSIDSAVTLWFNAVDGRSGSAAFRSGEPRLLWMNFLHAIKSHGGWSTVNDARTAIERNKRAADRAEKRRLAAKAYRARRTNPGPQRGHLLSPEFARAVEDERDRRLFILENIWACPGVPPYISKLSSAGRIRTVDVWAARTTQLRAGGKVTCAAIAARLVLMGKHGIMQPDSLRTEVSRSLKRIAKLEDSSEGRAIWEAFHFSG